MFLTLYANDQGEVIEHPHLQMLGRSGNQWVAPEPYEMIPLPKGASLVVVPERIPLGIARTGQTEYFEQDMGGQKVSAVAALLPQGFTRTLLPAYIEKQNSVQLPLFGYAAAGFHNQKVYVAAVQSDKHQKWHPRNYNTDKLPDRISRLLKKYPHNQIYRQLAKCSLEYGCFTAQNIFYQRWEGGIPTSIKCNANCLGCISESHNGVKSPQDRLFKAPTLRDITEVGLEHLSQARDGIISFGQGCEGEPALNAELLAQAIEQIRTHTEQGVININTNGGYVQGIKKLCEAGLNAMRVTIFSVVEKNYNGYHRPVDYGWGHVEQSIEYALQKKLQVSVNLLIYPGFTDQDTEIQALLNFCQKYPIHMIQLRNLNIDPRYMQGFCDPYEPGLGMTEFIDILKREIPQVELGSYTHCT